MATAAVTPGTVAHRYAAIPEGLSKAVSVEHPTGEFTVVLSMNPQNPREVLRAALLRTARLLMRGEVCVPASLFPEEPP